MHNILLYDTVVYCRIALTDVETCKLIKFTIMAMIFTLMVHLLNDTYSALFTTAKWSS